MWPLPGGGPGISGRVRQPADGRISTMTSRHQRGSVRDITSSADHVRGKLMGTPRGWYDVGEGFAGLWDGERWTGDRIRHEQLQAMTSPPPPAAPPPPMAPPPPPPGRVAAPPQLPPSRPPRRLWVWAAGAVGVLIVLAAIGAALPDEEEVATAATTTTRTAQAATEPEPTVAADTSLTPAADTAQVTTLGLTTAEQATTTVPPAPTTTEAELTAGQRNAVRKAEDYLDFTSFSRSGLIKQLEYEGFSTEDATFAVDTVNPDWNEQAAKKAKEYLDFTSFSRSGLIKQLEYEGFTKEQATYGADQTGL